MTFEEMLRLLDKVAEDGGPGATLEKGELARGAQLVPLGAREPFSFDPADWRRGIISIKDTEVRIVAIEARERGKGAFKRLLGNILAAGLEPVVVAAMLDMPFILTHWGWRREIVDDDIGKLDLWRRPAWWFPR
jgi:hypothetical protein